MIRDYANHAANERTFLAWVRTGIAIIALGFVIEKFNLFLLTIAKTLAAEAPYPIQMQKLSGPVGRFGGLALILGGVALIVALGVALHPHAAAARRRRDLSRQLPSRGVRVAHGDVAVRRRLQRLCGDRLRLNGGWAGAFWATAISRWRRVVFGAGEIY